MNRRVSTVPDSNGGHVYKYSRIPVCLLAAAFFLPIQPAQAETTVSIDVVREVDSAEALAAELDALAAQLGLGRQAGP